MVTAANASTAAAAGDKDIAAARRHQTSSSSSSSSSSFHPKKAEGPNHVAKKPCRYGARCYRIHRGCKFLHPAAMGDVVPVATTSTDTSRPETRSGNASAGPGADDRPPTSVSPTNTTVSSSSLSSEVSEASVPATTTTTTTTTSSGGTVAPPEGGQIVEMVDFMAIEEQMLQQAKEEAEAKAKMTTETETARTSPAQLHEHQHLAHHSQSDTDLNLSATNFVNEETKNHRSKRQKQVEPKSKGAAGAQVEDEVAHLTETIIALLRGTHPDVAERALDAAHRRLRHLSISGTKEEGENASSHRPLSEEEGSSSLGGDDAVATDPTAGATTYKSATHDPRTKDAGAETAGTTTILESVPKMEDAPPVLPTIMDRIVKTATESLVNKWDAPPTSSDWQEKKDLNGAIDHIEVAPPATPPSKLLKIADTALASSPTSLPSALRNSPRASTATAAANPATSPVVAPRRRSSSVSFAPDVKEPTAASEPPATADTSVLPPSLSLPGTNTASSTEQDARTESTSASAVVSAEEGATIVAEESEADKKKRRMEEMRRQKALAADKKKQKKKIRHDKYLQEMEEAAEKRKAFWTSVIENEETAVDKLTSLCETEFCRSHGISLSRKELAKRVSSDSQDELRSLCQEAYRALLRDDIPTKVTVKDPKLQDWNGREGTIEFWDRSKSKFYVALETRKGKNVTFQYLAPECLEASTVGTSRKAKSKSDSSEFLVYVEAYFNNKYLMLNLDKGLVEGLMQARSIDAFLASFVTLRDHRDAQAKRLAEEARREEEERRQRRAEKHRRATEEWERRQREYAAQKERMREMRREHRRGNSCGPYCNCQRCAFERQFAGFFFHVPGGPSFHFGGPGADYFDFYDSDEEDEWDRRFNRTHEEDLRKKNEEAASTLGVAVDASAVEIKRAYRAKARMYHPDSYRPEYHEDGTTKAEAEEQFKKVSDAYDLLMSNLED